MDFKIRRTDDSIEEVSGEEVKLKGYKDFRFLIHKEESKEWCLRELTTGTNIASDRNKAEAKKLAREEIKDKTNGDKKLLIEAIAKYEIINIEK